MNALTKLCVQNTGVNWISKLLCGRTMYLTLESSLITLRLDSRTPKRVVLFNSSFVWTLIMKELRLKQVDCATVFYTDDVVLTISSYFENSIWYRTQLALWKFSKSASMREHDVTSHHPLRLAPFTLRVLYTQWPLPNTINRRPLKYIMQITIYFLYTIRNIKR